MEHSTPGCRRHSERTPSDSDATAQTTSNSQINTALHNVIEIENVCSNDGWLLCAAVFAFSSQRENRHSFLVRTVVRARVCTQLERICSANVMPSIFIDKVVCFVSRTQSKLVCTFQPDEPTARSDGIGSQLSRSACR